MKSIRVTEIITLSTGEVLLIDGLGGQAVSVIRHNERYSSAQWLTLFQAEERIAGVLTGREPHRTKVEDVPRWKAGKAGTVIGGLAF